MAEAVVKLRVDAGSATRALQGVQNQTNQLQKSFGGLRTAIAGIGIGLLAKQTVSATANFQALQIRMRVLTSEFGEFAQVQQLVAKAQDKFNLSIIEATQGITDIFARLRPLGVELKDIEKTFFGFNSIAKIAGLNATEASAAFTQLAQGLGSGRLQGDEFRSIAEQVPQLLKAISDETGIASGKLKDFASKGLLKSDIIIRALSKSAEGLGKQIEEIIDESPAEKFKKLNNELLELQLTLGSKLTPVLADAAVAAASLVESFTKFVDSEAGQVALIITGAVLAVKALSAAIAFTVPLVMALKTNLATMSIAAAAANGQLGASATLSFAAAGGFTKAAIAAKGFKIALAKLGIGVVIIALGQLVANIMAAKNAQQEFNEIIEKGSVADIEEQINKANESIDLFKKRLELFEEKGFKALAKGALEDIKEAEDLIKKLEVALEKAKGKSLTKDFEKQKKLLEEQNEKLEESIKKAQMKTDEARNEFDLQKKIGEIEEKFGETEAKILKDLIKQNEELKKQENQIKKNKEAAEELKEKFTQIGEDIEQGIVDNLTDAVMGTQSLADAAINVLNQLKRKLIEVAIQQAVSGIGGKIGGFLGKVFGGGKASGGPVAANKSFVVGEKGPEILTMGSSRGFITPNNKLGGGDNTTNIVNVSVDANDSAVSGNDAGAEQLGAAIALAVQQQLVKEKRSGGLLAR